MGYEAKVHLGCLTKLSALLPPSCSSRCLPSAAGASAAPGERTPSGRGTALCPLPPAAPVPLTLRAPQATASQAASQLLQRDLDNARLESAGALEVARSRVATLEVPPLCDAPLLSVAAARPPGAEMTCVVGAQAQVSSRKQFANSKIATLERESAAWKQQVRLRAMRWVIGATVLPC